MPSSGGRSPLPSCASPLSMPDANLYGLGFSKLESDERYDWSRKEGPDPRGPRCLGAPCNGSHAPARPYRGSHSGSNRHGLWRACERCRLRLLYVPAWGAHARYRSAGPLPQDTHETLNRQEGEGTLGSAAAAPELRTKEVALEGAERSALEQLERIRAQRKGKAAPTPTPSSVPQPKPAYPKPKPATQAGAKTSTASSSEPQSRATAEQSTAGSVPAAARRPRRERPPPATRARASTQQEAGIPEAYDIGDSDYAVLSDAPRPDQDMPVWRRWKRLLARALMTLQEQSDSFSSTDLDPP